MRGSGSAGRRYGTAPRRVPGPDRARLTAIILLGYASALRRCELTALTLGDVEARRLLLDLRHSKTDQEGHGEVVGVAHGIHPITDPVAALDVWRGLRGRASRPLFTRIWVRPGQP